MTVSPEGIRQHLQVNASTFNDDYDKMKDIIIAYLRSRRSWTSTSSTPTDIEVDIAQKGKDKGKGKDKTKSKYDYNTYNAKGDYKARNLGRTRAKAKARPTEAKPKERTTRKLGVGTANGKATDSKPAGGIPATIRIGRTRM